MNLVCGGKYVPERRAAGFIIVGLRCWRAVLLQSMLISLGFSTITTESVITYL